MGCLFCMQERSAQLEQQGPALLLAIAVLLLQVLHQQAVILTPLGGQGNH